ncbi:unnamed protein product, partial [Effrenium voratum]
MAERISNEPWVTKLVAAWKEVVFEGTKQERLYCKQDELLKGISDNMVLNSETEDGIKLKEDLCKQNANL